MKKNKVEEIKKVAQEKARQGEKKAKASYAQAAKKEEEGKKKVEEANQGLAEKKDKLQKPAQQLQAGPKPDEVMKISKEMSDLAREVKKDEETSRWGMSEEEAAQEDQAWSKVGTKGRYVHQQKRFSARVFRLCMSHLSAPRTSSNNLSVMSRPEATAKKITSGSYSQIDCAW